jgi:hypothetical protein
MAMLAGSILSQSVFTCGRFDRQNSTFISFHYSGDLPMSLADILTVRMPDYGHHQKQGQQTRPKNERQIKSCSIHDFLLCG